MKITIYTTEYEPTPDGDRAIRDESHVTHEFDNPGEVAEYLVKHGITGPSSYPDYHHGMWWCDDPYEHPEGYTVQQTAHRDVLTPLGQATVTDAEWHDVWVRLTADPGEIVTHVVTSILTPAKRYPNRAYVSSAVASIARVAILKLAAELGETDDLRQMIEAYNDSTLDNAVVGDPSEPGKLELVHVGCQAALCDVDPGDSLSALISTATAHTCR